MFDANKFNYKTYLIKEGSISSKNVSVKIIRVSDV